MNKPLSSYNKMVSTTTPIITRITLYLNALFLKCFEESKALLIIGTGYRKFTYYYTQNSGWSKDNIKLISNNNDNKNIYTRTKTLLLNKQIGGYQTAHMLEDNINSKSKLIYLQDNIKGFC